MKSKLPHQTYLRWGLIYKMCHIADFVFKNSLIMRIIYKYPPDFNSYS